MRKIQILLLSCVIFGCSDFLEESSQDEVRPSTTDDLMQIMVGEAYPIEFLGYNYTDIFTDDMQCNGSGGVAELESAVEEMYPLFSWSNDMYEKIDADYNSWKSYYEKIMGCNTVLDYVDKVTGEQSMKDNMRGQALVLRGYYYFMLVNYYGLPYNYGNPKENLGVPLKLEMAVNADFMERNTVAEVYERVLEDITTGIELIEANPKEMSLYKISALAGKAMLSRIYLYMEDWDNALKYCNMVLEEKSTLTSLATAPEEAMQWQGSSDWSVYNQSVSNEIIWMYGRDSEMPYSDGDGYGSAPYTVSDELLGLYEFSEDASNHLDLRRYMYFRYGAFLDWATFYIEMFAIHGWHGGKVNGDVDKVGRGIRTAEIYLNRAEVYVRKYVETGDDDYRVLALADLNELRRHRYDTRNAVYVEVDITDAEELFQFYKDERRRELCFEDHRWFDLRRYGMPELVHEYLVGPGTEEVLTLKEHDLRYVLPIPQEVLDRNPYLQQNVRK